MAATVIQVFPNTTQIGTPARNCVITGTGFFATASITIGGVAATDVVVRSTTRITFTAPIRLTAAVVNLVLTNGDASVTTKTNFFTYFSASVTHPTVVPIDIVNETDADVLAAAACGPGVSYVGGSGLKGAGNDLTAFGTFANLLDAGPLFSASGTPGSIVANYCRVGGWDSGLLISTGDVIKLRDHQTAVEVAGYEGVVSTDFAPAAVGAPGVPGDDISFQFDFIPTYPILVIPFLFTTEEIPVFVGSAFNDSVSLKLNLTEIGYFPDRTTRITINNFATEAAIYYFGNAGKLYGLLNGGVPFYIVAFVHPGNTYTLKLQVTDVGDGRYDSAGFIGYLTSYPAMYPTSVSEGSGGTDTPDLTDFLRDLYPQIPEPDLTEIIDALLIEAAAAGALLTTPPAGSQSLWRLHRFDLKPRAEERA